MQHMLLVAYAIDAMPDAMLAYAHLDAHLDGCAETSPGSQLDDWLQSARRHRREAPLGDPQQGFRPGAQNLVVGRGLRLKTVLALRHIAGSRLDMDAQK